MKSRKLGFAFIIAGIACIILAFALILYNRVQNKVYREDANEVLDELEKQLPYREILNGEIDNNETSVENIYDNVEYIGGEDDIDTPKNQYQETYIDIDGVSYIGIINIPSLDITLSVTDECDLAKMKFAACRYLGSKESNDLIICAHNLASFFSPIKDMDTGEKIIFVDAAGNKFVYTVVQIETVGGYDIDAMKAGSDEWDITLFTCTYGGKNRVAVRAVLDE